MSYMYADTVRVMRAHLPVDTSQSFERIQRSLPPGPGKVDSRQAPKASLQAVDAPLPQLARGASGLDTTPKRTASQLGAFFGRFAGPVATVLLGATLALGLGGCATTHRGVTMNPEVVVAQTQIQQIPSVASRAVRAQIAAMETSILGDATPPMAFMPAAGKATQTRAGSYKTHTVPRWDVTGLGARGELGALLLLPVSGHVGDSHQARIDNARHFADIDLHRVWVKHPSGPESVLFDEIPAAGRLVTPQEAFLTLQPGLNVLCWDPMPGKTGGVDGFPSGRSIEIYWDGN